MTPELPDGVAYHTFGDDQLLATRGPPVYGEPTDGSWRRWDPRRSKVGAMLEKGLPTGLAADQTILYLGAANGTTVSHVADFAGPTYTIEFAPRPTRDLLTVAADRPNLMPLLKDARKPETYAHIVENGVDVLIQDVATRGQAEIARRNRQFLAPDGRLVMALKARSEDVTASPETIFTQAKETLQTEFTLITTARLEPFHEDHLAIIAEPQA